MAVDSGSFPLPKRIRAISLGLSARNSLLAGSLFFLVAFAYLVLIQFSTPDLPDNDGFYHIKMAWLMRTEGLKPDFPWLPLSILNSRQFYDHHFLFHVALIPFTFGDLIQGAKWAAVFFASLALLSLFWLFKSQRLPHAWLWALASLAISPAFLYRMSLPRAQSLSLVVLILGLGMMLKGRFKFLLPLAFVYVWLYDAFPLLFILAGLYSLGVGLVERRLELRPLLYAGLGTVFGMLINPYFPHNLVFATLHILPKLGEATAARVGNEWFPYETTQLIRQAGPALLAFLSGAFALGLSGRRMESRTAVSFLAATLFGLMLFQARRFVEYFPAFALIFAAFAWTAFIAPAPVEASGGQFLRRIRPHLLPALCLALLLPLAWYTFSQSGESIQRAKPSTLYASASAWLQANTPAGERIFQTDWDDFPRLFYYNNHNTYLVGLDPTYMQLYDAEMYDLWAAITRGEVEQPSRYLLPVFGARYILSDLNHKTFLRQADQDPGLDEVYRDADAVIYRLGD